MNDWMIWIAAFTLTLAVSYGGVGLFARWARRQRLLDIPNERSSHASPTPSSAGVVFAALTLLAAAGIALTTRQLPLLGYAAAALLITAVSWWDDRHPLPSGARFLVHAAAALLLLATLGAPAVPGLGPGGGLVGGVIGLVWIVGLTNAVNFMDGIDGMAGLQGAAAAAGWLIVGRLAGSDFVFWTGLVLLAALVGFLAHNWSPASIFMGDAGSAFLGFTLAAFPLILSETAGAGTPGGAWGLLLAAALFLWPILFDTSLTLLLRLWRRENIFRPHRGHLYQRLIIRGLSHAWVTTLYGALAIWGVGVAVGLQMKVVPSLWLSFISIIVLALGLLLYVNHVERQPVDRLAGGQQS